MNIKEAQSDMRSAYLGGSAGILSSGIVWIIAGIVAIISTNKMSALVFFFGGMLIHPLSLLILKLLNRTGSYKKDNPLAYLAFESTLLLFIGLFIAYIIYLLNPILFYPIMLLTIGGRYVTFQSIYGIKSYWALGVILIAAAIICILFNLPFYSGAFLGGVIELVFSILIFKSEKK